jgi:hypothetical protein
MRIPEELHVWQFLFPSEERQDFLGESFCNEQKDRKANGLTEFAINTDHEEKVIWCHSSSRGPTFGAAFVTVPPD